MFGYVTLNKPEVKVREFYRYQGYYCGLCQSLKKRHGISAQLCLNYDMTFLAILLTGLYEPETFQTEYRCPFHPIKKLVIQSNEYIDYTADMTVLLSYYQCLDNWKDEKKLSGFAQSRLLKNKVKKLSGKYPRQFKAIRGYVRKLTQKELSGSRDVDELSGLTGQMLGELFVMKNDMWSETLRQIGFYLGKFIYLMDAYEDLPKDLEKKQFNPLVEKCRQPEYEAYIQQALNTMMARCALEFEKLPVILDVEILRNILYAGVWVRYEKIRISRKTEESKA